MKKILILFAFIGLVFEANAQKLTINGYVKDASDGEGLIGSTVYVQELQNGVATNAYGFYSITLSPGTYHLVFSYSGYISQTKEVVLASENISLNIELSFETTELEEVIIKSETASDNVRNIEMSTNKVDIATVKKIPALLGEVDLVRSIQLLPGVSTVGEGASGFNVRGGNVDQNLVLLDGAPVYNSSHLFGFFSVFNPDAVKDVKLYKGGIPAQYGGRASSILDVKMKEGNSKKLEVNGGIGLIFSRLSLEAPIVKDKASFIIAARRSYIDVLAKPFLTGSVAGAKFNFYDLTAKVNYSINEKNSVFASGYFGRDVFGSGFGFNWGNSTLSTRWNHIFSDKLFFNLTAFYSNYDYLLDSDLNKEKQSDYFKWNSNIINKSLKPEFTYYINPSNTLNFGGQIIAYDFKPGDAMASSAGIVREFGLSSKLGLESAIYIGHDWKISDNIEFQYGLRYSNYQFRSPDNIYYERIYSGITIEDPSGYQLIKKTAEPNAAIAEYGNIEPRAAINFILNENSSIKMSFNKMAQYVHLMSNTAASTPLDVWTTTTNNIKPQIAEQFALGWFKNFGLNDDIEFSMETYYKKLSNQIDYADRSNLFLNPMFEKDLLFGEGRAYGLETFLRKNEGKLTGWISYTLSRTERKVNGLNNGEWFLSRFDRTHNFNIVSTYELNKRYSIGGNFAFITGVPYSLPIQKFDYQGIAYPLVLPGTRGNMRVTDYHRMDFSLTKKLRKSLFKKGEAEWVISLYNVYNRRNAYSIYTQPNADNSLMTEAVRLSVIGSIVPAFTYNFKF